MENILMTFFWICIISANLANAKPVCLRDAKICQIRDYVKCPSNSTFYAPTIGNDTTQRLCKTTSLDCCVKELGKIQKQCNGLLRYVGGAAEYLNRRIYEWKDSHPLTNSSQCACEGWPKTSLSGFLDKMTSLLQLVNNKASLKNHLQPPL